MLWPVGVLEEGGPSAQSIVLMEVTCDEDFDPWLELYVSGGARMIVMVSMSCSESVLFKFLNVVRKLWSGAVE